MADENTILEVINQRINSEQTRLKDVNEQLTAIKSQPTTKENVQKMLTLVNTKIAAEHQIQTLQSI